MEVVLAKKANINEVVGSILDILQSSEVNYRVVIGNGINIYLYKTDENQFNKVIKQIFKVNGVRAMIIKGRLVMIDDLENENEVKNKTTKKGGKNVKD